MCGIIGYVGHEQVAPILLEGLRRMEYRGYDSAGVAVCSPEGGLEVRKTKGRIQALADMILQRDHNHDAVEELVDKLLAL